MRTKIIIATRSSALALVQAETVRSLLESRWPGLDVELLKLKTQGDILLDKPLRDVGGKALFVKEIEEALLDKRADIAVHSMKDVPGQIPAGLEIPVILKRENPQDAWVSEKFPSLKNIPQKSKIGTTSLRRKVQLLKQRPDLEVLELRGNVDTRLKKLHEGNFDAIILAAAGLNRLGKSDVIRELLPFIWAPGQGAVGIESREEDTDLKKLIQPFADPDTEVCVKAERVVLKRLEGGCQLPVGAQAELENNKIHLKAFVSTPDGQKYLEDHVVGDSVLAEDLGEKLSEILLKQGAAEILDKIRKS